MRAQELREERECAYAERREAERRRHAAEIEERLERQNLAGYDQGISRWL
jgi:hypothetical protein